MLCANIPYRGRFFPRIFPPVWPESAAKGWQHRSNTVIASVDHRVLRPPLALKRKEDRFFFELFY